MDVVIDCKNVACQSGKKYLIRDINWQVKRGEHWVLFGQNGCGKTTLLSIIAGFKGNTKGEVTVFGEQYTQENIFDIRKRIGWVSSSFFDKYLSWESALTIVLSGVSGTLSMSKNITDADVKRAIKLLNQFGVGDKIDQPFSLMSKGERQCVLIARALINNPEILILDEPGTGLDVYAREYVLTMIDYMAKHTDMTIIYVTHYVEEVLPSFDKAILMKDGRFYKMGEKNQSFQDDIIGEFLGYPVEIKSDDFGKINITMQLEYNDH